MSAWSDVDWNGPGCLSIASVAIASAFFTRCNFRSVNSATARPPLSIDKITAHHDLRCHKHDPAVQRFSTKYRILKATGIAFSNDRGLVVMEGLAGAQALGTE